jgi:alkanesulfonate monooxygenase SsuD/methylene tetrahydromethanopterin reductase-like flavin-dependent oxidoreductase (luciferase family)
MEEGIEIIRRLWAGETLAYNGKRFSFSQASISPLPVQRPGPLIWIGGSRVPAYARAAKLADGILVEPAAANSTLVERMAAYREALPPTAPGQRRDVVLMRGTYTSHDAAKLQCATDAYLRYFKESCGRLGALDVTGPSGTPPTDYYSIFIDRFVIGSPDECVERIQGYRDMGVDYYIIMGSQLPGFPRDEVVESMQLFAREVIPHFR